MIHFEKLVLSGFKSFVERTEILLGPGLTGIVGPNGCGKSNLVEALRWVMGETSAKALRGTEMDDVIFAGTATRPPRDFAEVAIELSLPVGNDAAGNNGTGLTISRRIDRSRGSSYRVDGREVRHRDVQVLLADRATGARSTALVTHGQVTSVITNKPTERRVLLEEAAGIIGLRSRRGDAEARLLATAGNLARLDEHVGSLERRRSGLSQQAKRASRYRRLSEQIRATETLLIALSWQSAVTRSFEATKRLAESARTLAQRQQEADDATSVSTNALTSLPLLRLSHERAVTERHRLEQVRSTVNTEAELCASSSMASTKRRLQSYAELKREEGLVRDARATLQRLRKEQSALQSSIAAVTEEGAAIRKAIENGADQLRTVESELGHFRHTVATMERERERLQHQSAEAERHLRRLAARATEMDKRGTIRAADRNALSQLVEAEANAAEAGERLTLARTAREIAEDRVRRLSQEATAAYGKLAAAQAAVVGLETEIGVLRKVVDSAPVGSRESVLSVLKVQSGFEAAVAAAIGDDLFASEDLRAHSHWRYLPPIIEVAEFPPPARPLTGYVEAPSVLGRWLAATALVDHDLDGERLLPSLTPGQQVVSRDGRVWRWDGLVRSNDTRPQARTLLEAAGRVCQLSEFLRAALKARQQAEAETGVVHRDFTSAREDERKTRVLTGEAEKRSQNAQARLLELRGLVARIEGEAEAHHEQAALLARDLDHAHAVVESAREALTALPDESNPKAALVRAEESSRGLQNALLQRKLALATIENTITLQEHQLEAISAEVNTWQERLSKADELQSLLKGNLTAIDQELANLQRMGAEIALRRVELQRDSDQAEKEAHQANEALVLAEDATRKAEINRRQADGALAHAREEHVLAQASLAQAKSEETVVTARAQNKFGDAWQSWLGKVSVSKSADLAAVDSELRHYEREREQLGPVNLCAEEEVARLDEEINAASAQRADLQEAVVKLGRAVADLEAESRTRLMAALSEIHRHFSALFTQLFGGGSAELVLTDNDDPHGAGLEIRASPPGKRLQALSLLSGGEQALTALALRFALFLARPAPICVLDEVDAPLDEANVERFCDLLRTLAANGTRFFVITHQRLTMARMDRLYGVTMVEKGISQLVSIGVGSNEALATPLQPVQ